MFGSNNARTRVGQHLWISLLLILNSFGCFPVGGNETLCPKVFVIAKGTKRHSDLCVFSHLIPIGRPPSSTCWKKGMK